MRRGRALAAVGQREAVLPFCRRKVGRGEGCCLLHVTRVHSRPRQQQPLRHGGAGSVEPQRGKTGTAQRIARSDALIQQVAGEDKFRRGNLLPGLFQQQLHGGLLEVRFRLLPGLFPVLSVRDDQIKAFAQRTFSFLFPHYGGPGCDDGPVGEDHALFSAVQ